jgi:hypothetical protein
MKKIVSLFVVFLLSCVLFAQNTKSILKDGVKIIPSEGGRLVAFIQNDKIGFVLNSSDYIIMIEPKFDDIYNENFLDSNEMAIVSLDGKFGAVNTSLKTNLKNEPSIPCIYDSMTPFRNGKSKVTRNGLTFYINTRGEIIN